MDWNCTATEERLSDYLEGALAAADASAFAAHAAGCAHCSALVAQVAGLVRQMHQVELVEEPPHLVRGILDVTIGPRKQKQAWEGWFSWVPLVWQPRVGIGLATVAASLAIVLHAAGVNVRDVKMSDLRPANLMRVANRQAHLTYAHGAKFVNDLRVVYEIQSRLTPQTEPEAEPSPSPEPEPSTVDPREKSQATPRPNHREARKSAAPHYVLTRYAAEGWPGMTTRRPL